MCVRFNRCQLANIGICLSPFCLFLSFFYNSLDGALLKLHTKTIKRVKFFYIHFASDSSNSRTIRVKGHWNSKWAQPDERNIQKYFCTFLSYQQQHWCTALSCSRCTAVLMIVAQEMAILCQLAHHRRWRRRSAWHATKVCGCTTTAEKNSNCCCCLIEWTCDWPIDENGERTVR